MDRRWLPGCVRRRAAVQARLEAAGKALPTFTQWLRLLAEAPAGLEPAPGGLEWLRGFERSGAHQLGRALLLGPPPQVTLLPAHLPDPRVASRGVLDLWGK